MTPKSYQLLVALEVDRYAVSMEDACEELREKPEHAPHYERTKIIHNLLQSLVSLYAADYLVNAESNLFSTHHITEENILVPHSERSAWERYIAGIRSILQRVEKSYLLRSSFVAAGLEWLASNTIHEYCGQSLELLKNLEVVCRTFETYMTWTEHGAQLSMKYQNANTLAEADEGEEVDILDEENLYNDVLVRAYAMLKTFDKDSQRAAQLLDLISLSLKSIAHLVGVSQKLYVKVPPTTVENVLHTLVTPKQNKPTYTGTKFANIQELNEKLRTACKESLEEQHGFLYNIFELLDATRCAYLSRLASYISDTLIFLPTVEKQEQFIRDFETGRLWKNTQ